MSVKYYVADSVTTGMNDWDKKNPRRSQWERFYAMMQIIQNCCGKSNYRHPYKFKSLYTSSNIVLILDVEICTYDIDFDFEYKVYSPLLGDKWFDETILSLENCDQHANLECARQIAEINEKENANV